jgi:hypothetical protein
MDTVGALKFFKLSSQSRQIILRRSRDVNMSAIAGYGP